MLVMQIMMMPCGVSLSPSLENCSFGKEFDGFVHQLYHSKE